MSSEVLQPVSNQAETSRSPSSLEVVCTIARLSQDKLRFQDAYLNLIHTLAFQTNLFTLFQDLGLFDEILDGTFNRNDQGIRFARFMASAGNHDPQTNLTIIKGNPVSRESIWMSLATTGDLPLLVYYAAHEEIHDLQVPDKDPGKTYFNIVNQDPWLVDWFAPNQTWHEAVAYRPTTFRPHLKTPQELVTHLLSQKPDGTRIYPQIKSDHALKAVEIIDQLTALGANINTLSRLSLTPPGWLDHTYVSPQLLVYFMKITKGLSQKDLATAVSQYRHQLSQDVITTRHLALALLK